MRRSRLIALSVVLAVAAADRVAKVLAERTLAGRPPVRLLGGLVRLDYMENPGAFLGLGGTLSAGARFWALTVGTGLLLAVLTYALAWRPPAARSTLVCWSLVLGGGLANLWDRLTRGGEVVDFVVVGWGALRTGVFNLADLAITTGALLVLLLAGREGPRHPPARPGPDALTGSGTAG